MQPGVVEAQFRAGLYARLLAKPNIGLEVPEPHPSGEADRALLPSPIPRPLPGRRGDRHWSWGRDAPVLERVQQGTLAEGNEIRTKSIHGYTVGISGSSDAIFGPYIYVKFIQ